MSYSNRDKRKKFGWPWVAGILEAKLKTPDEALMIDQIAEKLRSAQSVVLTTHRHGDGDGLGAQLALFHALRKMGKNVRILNLDKPPRKYDFLKTESWIQVFDSETVLKPTDLTLIFDTNDSRLVEPLFSRLSANSATVLFIDHHPVLKQGPPPTPGSLIDTSAASTGELTYGIIRALQVPLDAEIARALYTSIVFDTQLFRYVKGVATSHLLAAELLEFERSPEEIHRRLFSTYSVEKLAFLARALARVEYMIDDRLAVVHIHSNDIRDIGLDLDESGDVIDMIMNIETVEAAALLREDGEQSFKLSLRSKGCLSVLPIAERFGGGGHQAAAGAYIQGDYDDIRDRLVQDLICLVDGPLVSPPVSSLVKKQPTPQMNSNQRPQRPGSSRDPRKRPEIICRCNCVPRDVIEDAIRNGANTLNKIFDKTMAGVGSCGGSCRRKLQPMLDSYLETGEFPEVIKEDRKCKKR